MASSKGIGAQDLTIGDKLISINDQVAFAQPIIFATAQKIPTSTLVAQGEWNGDLLWNNGSSWVALPIGKPGQILLVGPGGPLWATFDVSQVIGILPASAGGTGFTAFKDGDLLIGANKRLQRLAVGTEGESLTIVKGSPTWEHVGSIRGHGVESGLAVFADNVCLQSLDLTYQGGVLSIASATASLILGDTNLSSNTDALTITKGAAYVMLRREGMIELGPNIRITSEGEMQGVKMHLGQLGGTLSVANGGTGLSSLEPNSILFSESLDSISVLSFATAEGKYLSVLNGRLTWSEGVEPADWAGDIPLTNPLISAVEGQVSRSAAGLFYVDSTLARRQVVLQGDALQGTADNVRGIVVPANGGTGADLSSATKGQVAYFQDNGQIGSTVTGVGFLYSQGSDAAPLWVNAVASVVALDPLVVTVKGNQVTISIDQNQALNWGDLQTFAAVEARGPMALNQRTGSHLSFVSEITPASPQSGDMWWDGTHLNFKTLNGTVRLTDRGQAAAKPSHPLYVELARALHPTEDARRLSVPYVVPYDTDGISPINFAITNVEWRRDAGDISSEVQANLTADGNIIYSPMLLMAGGTSSCVMRDLAITSVRSGDLLLFTPIVADDTLWSLRLTLQRA
jgi:hypothetical protein